MSAVRILPRMEYLVRRTTSRPLLDREWTDAQVGTIAHFHRTSSDHRPVTCFKLLYDDAGIYIQFDVRDRYVLCRRTEDQAMVCRDSCVEAFLQPTVDRGYFNFEINCCGAMLLWYVTDAQARAGRGVEGVGKSLAGADGEDRDRDVAAGAAGVRGARKRWGGVWRASCRMNCSSITSGRWGRRRNDDGAGIFTSARMSHRIRTGAAGGRSGRS